MLTARSLHIHIADKILLDHEDFLLREGERVGLVGRNGIGKTTLLRVLAGEEHFFTGDLSFRPNLRVAYLAQEARFRPGQTVEQAVLEGAHYWLDVRRRYESLPHDAAEAHRLEAELQAADAWDLRPRLERLLTDLKAPPPDRCVDNLSGGEKRRVALCRTLIGDPGLLLLDEPTNHLDTATIEWIEETLRRRRCTVLFITHDRAFLDNVCTRIVEMAFGHLYSHHGNYRDYVRGKAKREAEAEVQEQRRLSFIRREADWIGRGPKARGTKSRARIQRYQDAVEQPALRREQNVDLIIPAPPRLGNLVLSLENVGIAFGETPLFQDFSHDFEPGERLGIVGANGLGKTSLLRVILGQLTPWRGRVRVGECTRFNYADQHRELLDGEKMVFEEVGEGKEYVELGAQRITLWAYLKRFLFTDEEIHTRVDQLSGGERNRVVLAKILRRGGNFLVLDEPTNDLDLSTLRVLEEALVSFGGCVVVVSHDRFFLNRVCTGILGFEGNGKLHYEPGDYDYYAAKRAARKKEECPVESRPASRSTRPARPRPRKLTYREQQELDGMEENILAAEQEVAELEALFSQPNFFAEHGPRAAELKAELEEKMRRVESLYARWEELESLKQNLS